MSVQEEIMSKIAKYTEANNKLDAQEASLDLTTMYGRITKVEIHQAREDNNVRITNLKRRLTGTAPEMLMSDIDTAHMDALMASEDGEAYR
jgi:hypothetical protein